MPRFFMPIASAFAPNYTLKDVLIACRFLLPWNWNGLQEGKYIPRLEEDFRRYMDARKAISFDSGRSGFFAILKAMDVREGDEVILQAFTTVALPNTIKLFGAKPVYADIDKNTYNMDPGKIEKKITKKTKIMVIQHTFGNPAEMDRIIEIAKKHDLRTIEDCAHSLGAECKGKRTGKFADAAFFSFGRDKVISSVSGGMVIAEDYKLAEKIEAIRNSMGFPAKRSVAKKLLHPILTFKALHTYSFFSIGKAVMFASLALRLIDKAYTGREKACNPSRNFAKKMPNALAALAVHQLQIADKFNKHRIKTAERYAKLIKNNGVKLPSSSRNSKNIFLWYTIEVKNKKDFIEKARGENMVFGDWFPQPIGPIEVDMEKAGYEKGSCPNAEKVSMHCVNLPTHHNIGEKEILKISDFINNYQ